MIPKEERVRRIPNSYVPKNTLLDYDPIPHTVTALHKSEVEREYANMRGWFPDSLVELKDLEGNDLFVWWSEIYHAWDVYYTETFVDPFMGTNEYRYVRDWTDSATGESGREDRDVKDVLDANVVTSKVNGLISNSEHKPVLDIDNTVAGKFFFDLIRFGYHDHLKIYPSTNPGHYHVYVDRRMSWSDYCRWMECLVALGILEEGFYNASIARGYSAVRLPWIAKQY